MKILYTCIALLAVLQRLPFTSAQSVTESGTVAANPGDLQLVNESEAGSLGSHVHDPFDDKAFDRVMDSNIATMEEKPQEIKQIMKVLSTVDLSYHPTLQNLVDMFKNNVNKALTEMPALVEQTKYLVATDRREREKKKLASTKATETKVTRVLAAAQKLDGTVVGTSNDISEAELDATTGGQDIDDANMNDIGSSYDLDDGDLGESDSHYRTTHRAMNFNDLKPGNSGRDSGDDFHNHSGKDHFKSKSKKSAGGRGRSHSRSYDFFGSHTSPHSQRFQSFRKIQQGVLDGNHGHLMGIIGRAHAHATTAHRNLMDVNIGGRRLGKKRDARKAARAAAREERKNKPYPMGKQCMILTKCVSEMSLYDTMVYFYSDDLNPGTGELDDSIIHFDEDVPLGQRHDDASALAKGLLEDNKEDPKSYETKDHSRCNELLQLFHRNIEHDGVPHWEGGTVSQVCLAQGSQVYISMDQIATKISLEAADDVAREVFSCAQSLYHSPARNKLLKEPFVFSPKEGRAYEEVKEHFTSYGEWLQQTFEYDFFVPTGLNFDSTARDEFGHAINVSVPLYSYYEKDTHKVYQQLSFLRQSLEEHYRTIWRDHFKDHDEYSHRYGNVEKDGSVEEARGSYKAAHRYYQILKDAMDDEDLQTMVDETVASVSSSYAKRTHPDEIQINPDVMIKREDMGDYEKVQTGIEEVYKGIQKGLSIALGDKASVGFLCGIKEAVQKKGYRKFPGTCCLDTPYEGKNDNWGREHSCDARCEFPGPFFGGLDEHACDAQGGTWCPKPADCTVLKDCIDEQIKVADRIGKLAYKTYLEPAVITEPFDAYQCGKSRKYFGYEELYTNDEDICENFQQLHNNKDYGFLEEFYEQGSGGGDDSGSGSGRKPLVAPDHTGSTELARQEKIYKSTLFAMHQSYEMLGHIRDLIEGMKCPNDISGVVQTVCALAINSVHMVMTAIIGALNLAHDAAQYTCDTLIGTSDANLKESFEKMDPIFGNMDIMYNTLYGEMQSIKEKLGDGSKTARNLGVVGGLRMRGEGSNAEA